MKYSYNWLRELTKTKKNSQELAEMVGLRGFELEEIESLKDRFKDFVVGEVVSLDKHPNADRLWFVRVDVGGKQIVEIVCGAQNFKVGDKVPVALPGSILPQNKLKIEKREVRGIISNGMICAEDELGLGKDHSGIMVLGSDAQAGQPIDEFLGLEDEVIDFDILPDRAHDCLNYEGMAREICAMENKKFQTQEVRIDQEKNTDVLKVSIEDESGCSRYIGAVLEGVEIGPSPDWMKARLVASGMEPINNVVDITNYVMLEVGNPLHAFDYSKIEESGKEIVVRRARDGEKLELLDETKIDLDQDDLIISGKEKPLALAGIKGGKDSGISKQTTRIVLEAANFNGFDVRKSRQKHNLLTEAQARFEKGLSSVLAKRGALRAIELLQQYANATLVGVIDEDKSKNIKQELNFDLNSVGQLLGYNVDKNESLKILQNLGFEVDGDGDIVNVFVPYWRLDIEGPEHLIEEVGRIIGYEKIDEAGILAPVSVSKKNLQREFEWGLKDFFVSSGFSEVRNYSFYGPKDIQVCDIKEEHFELQKPLSEDLSFMRKTLVPGLLRNVAHNLKFFEEVSIFEIGRVFIPGENNNPIEKNKIAVAFSSRPEKRDEMFFFLKGQFEFLLEEQFGISVFFEDREITNGILNSKRRARILLEKDSSIQLGEIGEVDFAVAKKYGIKERVIVCEIDFETLQKFSKKTKTYQTLRKYPTIMRDISIYVSSKTKARDIFSVIKRAGGKNLIGIDLFDVYVNKEKEKKSLAYHLTFGKENRTMKSEEVDDIIESIVEELKQKDVELRMK